MLFQNLEQVCKSILDWLIALELVIVVAIDLKSSSSQKREIEIALETIFSKVQRKLSKADRTLRPAVSSTNKSASISGRIAFIRKTGEMIRVQGNTESCKLGP